MENILDTLNFQMRKETRNVILFLNNSTVHLNLLIDMYSSVKIVFLSKNMTSRLQPLHAGIIQGFKTKYRKKLFRYVVARIKMIYLPPKLQKALIFLKLSHVRQMLGRRLALKRSRAALQNLVLLSMEVVPLCHTSMY